MLTLGTGIGGALIINGKLFDGHTFDAGDFGHHVICSGEQAFDCVCGRRGCFESQASADGLVRHFRRTTGSREDLKAIDIVERARAGDEAAINAFANYREDLSTGLANVVTFYNPDVLCLGGGLAQSAELFRGLTKLVDRKSLPATRGSFRIVPAALGTDAGAIGAALLEAVL